MNLGGVKPSEKISVPTGFAQLVQTSTGKHILFTPSSSISASNFGIPGNATGKVYSNICENLQQLVIVSWIVLWVWIYIFSNCFLKIFNLMNVLR